MRTACVLGGLVMMAATASADGEYGPMIGGAVVAAQGPDQIDVAGLHGELSLWRGRLGLAVETSRQWDAAGEGARVAAVAASLRALVYRQLVPSLIEPRDVELGFELHGIVERAWWKNVAPDRAPISYGAGLAVRLRGGSDDLSNLIVESRLFVRVLATRWTRDDVLARGEAMAGTSERELSIMIGLGAAFGGGDLDYVQRFRPRPLDAFSALAP